MALTRAMFSVLKDRLGPGKLASMGYPDIIVPDKDLEELIGSKIYSIERRKDSEQICKRHQLKDRQIVDSRSFFSCLGVELVVFDVVKDRGEEVICDLNHPIPGWHHESYDFVIDIGTLEHCFNVSQALINMASMVKVGGLIFHENPFNWGNHGFYGFNPTLFNDFYTHNGFEVVECLMVDREGKTHEAERTRRFVLTGGEANILAVVRRNEVREFGYPIQTKYKSSIVRVD